MWDRAVTFKTSENRDGPFKTLLMIANKMGADGFKIFEIQGPYCNKVGDEVWVLKVQLDSSVPLQRLVPDSMEVEK